jgi:hypothetical protein
LFVIIFFIIFVSTVPCCHLEMYWKWELLTSFESKKDSNIFFDKHTPSTMEGRCAFCNNAVVISGVMENGKLYHPKCTPSARGMFLPCCWDSDSTATMWGLY